MVEGKASNDCPLIIKMNQENPVEAAISLLAIVDISSSRAGTDSCLHQGIKVELQNTSVVVLFVAVEPASLVMSVRVKGCHVSAEMAS
jgi:hypothetical protein